MRIKKRRIKDLREDPENLNTHNERSLQSVARSLDKYGQQKPIVITKDGVVVAGNGTLAAAKALGWTEVATVETDLTDRADLIGYAIADNRTAELSEWDVDALARVAPTLPDDVREATGWTDDELAALVKASGGVGGGRDIDQANEEIVDPGPGELREQTVSVRGDVWTLGDHILVCGDSMAGDLAYSHGLPSDGADMIWTDPPYGVNYVGSPTKSRSSIENDAPEPLRCLLAESFGVAISWTRPGAVWYVASPPGPPFLEFAEVLTNLEVWRQTLVWKKDALVFGRSDFHYIHETLFYGWTPGAAHLEPPDRKQTTVLEFDRPRRSTEHPTMKPLELVEYCVSMSSREGDCVLEPFSGSGTTIIACERLSRSCYAIELSPAYVDVAVRRWQEATGNDAVDADGKTFNDREQEAQGADQSEGAGQVP